VPEDLVHGDKVAKEGKPAAAKLCPPVWSNWPNSDFWRTRRGVQSDGKNNEQHAADTYKPKAKLLRTGDIMLEIKRGEIYWINWHLPGAASKQDAPALVIQNDTGNLVSSTVIVAACTTSNGKHYPF